MFDWHVFSYSKCLHSSPFPVRSPAGRCLLTGTWLPDSGAPGPERRRWQRWRRRRGRLLPPRRCPARRRCWGAQDQTARQSGTPRRTPWGPCRDPEKWGESQTPHRRDLECGMSTEQRAGREDGRSMWATHCSEGETEGGIMMQRKEHECHLERKIKMTRRSFYIMAN